ncbi:hypothetical protein [Geodermatophilus sabuli]|uniref:DUF2550 family protein n=1 Tax=Geodermatophilus sabuli TaxID=1564158 RepID=A0A285EE90_9ACTN|nr:hypothetical protein [Geodermatophilus sabuli]MBB3084495.1 hypothetical protein [Geodermatophilus sabuli]SNX97310.1 hypothetical protein SAMN06893097_106260 [Geodermatophilus sabuli]
MSPVLVALGGVALVGTTVVVLAVWGRIRYDRELPFFRCRVSAPPWSRRGQHARWCLRRTRAAWVDGVLLLRSGLLRLWLTPLAVGVGREVTVEALEPGQVRGLGRRPVALRFTAHDGCQMEVAAAHEDVGRLVGPFLTAALSGLPEAPRERGV